MLPHPPIHWMWSSCERSSARTSPTRGFTAGCGWGMGGKVGTCGSCWLPPKEDRMSWWKCCSCPTTASCSAHSRHPRAQGAGACAEGRRFWGAAGDAGPVGCLCRGLAIPTQPLCIWPSAPPHAAATGNISSINQIIPLTRLNLLLSKPLHHLSVPSQQGSGGSSWITAGCSESSGAAVCSQRLSGYKSERQGRAGAGNGGCCLLLH